MFLPESGHSQRPWPGARWIAPVDPWQPTSLRRRRSGSANGRVRALAARKLLFRQRQSGGRATKLRRAFRSLGIAASLARARHERRWGNSREMGCAAAASAHEPAPGTARARAGSKRAYVAGAALVRTSRRHAFLACVDAANRKPTANRPPSTVNDQPTIVVRSVVLASPPSMNLPIKPGRS